MKVDVQDTTDKTLEAVKKALDIVKYGEIIIKMHVRDPLKDWTNCISIVQFV